MCQQQPLFAWLNELQNKLCELTRIGSWWSLLDLPLSLSLGKDLAFLLPNTLDEPMEVMHLK